MIVQRTPTDSTRLTYFSMVLPMFLAYSYRTHWSSESVAVSPRSSICVTRPRVSNDLATSTLRKPPPDRAE